MTQYSRVKQVIESSDRPLTLHEIAKRIWSEFRKRDAETAISARIRDIRYDLELEGKTILSERVSPKKHHHKYWLSSLSGQPQ